MTVGNIDRRMMAAVDVAQRLDCVDLRGVHVAVDPSRVAQVSSMWSSACPIPMDLDVVDDIGGVGSSVASAALEWLRAGASEVVVVAGQMAMRGWGRWLLHDRTAASIASRVERLPGARALVVPVPLGADLSRR